MSKSVEWAEELPENCPPAEAHSANGGVFYRLVSQYPPTEDDFASHRKLFPKKNFHANECRVRATSILDDLGECNNLKLLPTQRRNPYIVKIRLQAGSGVVLQTGNNRAHFSWWRSKQYQAFVSHELIA